MLLGGQMKIMVMKRAWDLASTIPALRTRLNFRKVVLLGCKEKLVKIVRILELISFLRCQ